MLEHLLDEIFSLIGQGVVFSLALGAVLATLLWLLHVVSGPVDRLEHWRTRTAPQRTDTSADHLRGWAVVSAVVVLVAVVLQLTVGLR